MREAVIATVGALGAGAFARLRGWDWLTILIVVFCVWLSIFTYSEVWGVPPTS